MRTSAFVTLVLLGGCDVSPRVPSPLAAIQTAAAGDRLTYQVDLRVEGQTSALGDEVLNARGRMRGKWTFELLGGERLRGCWSEVEMLEVSLGSLGPLPVRGGGVMRGGSVERQGTGGRDRVRQETT